MVSTFFVLQQDESSMLVLAFYRKPRVNPVLLALGIITYVRVTHRHQITGSVF